MKTPKRYQNKPLPMLPEGADVDYNRIEDWCQRAKRKNRIAQLKRSLHRYKHGTNLPFYCHELHAYLLLQELTRPSENASVKKWESYILELSEICAHIEEARTWAQLAKRRKQEEEAACLAAMAYGEENEYYNKLSQQSRENLPVLTHSIPHSASKPKSVADLQNETWYYLKAKHTCNGMFLIDGCGGPYFELNDHRIHNCVYTPQAIKEQHRINPPANIDLTLTLDDRTGETRAALIEALATHKPAENGQQTNIPPTGGQQACVAQNARYAKKEEEQDEPFKVTHNPHAKQFEVIAITPDMTPMYIIPYSTAINAHKNYRIETARARAEAECARLNNEWKNKPTN